MSDVDAIAEEYIELSDIKRRIKEIVESVINDPANGWRSSPAHFGDFMTVFDLDNLPEVVEIVSNPDVQRAIVADFVYAVAYENSRHLPSHPEYVELKFSNPLIEALVKAGAKVKVVDGTPAKMSRPTKRRPSTT